MKGVIVDVGPSLIQLPLLPEQFYKLETFNLYNFVFCYCNSFLQSFVQGLFQMVLAMLV